MTTGVFVIGLVFLYAVCIYRLYLYTRPTPPLTRLTRAQKKELVREAESILRDGEWHG